MILSGSRAENILLCSRMLRDGGVVAIPTDTVYGLAASVMQPEAIERIFVVKCRAPDVAVPVLFASALDLPILVEAVPDSAWKLINIFWPGPLTLVLPARSSAPFAITRGRGTVAVRVPADRVLLQLLQTFGEPLVGTSANRHGEPPALTAENTDAEFGTEIDAVLAGNAPLIGLASTVAELRGNECIIHREGALTAARIRQVAGIRVEVK